MADMTTRVKVTDPNDRIIQDPELESVRYLDTILTFAEADKLITGNANVRLPADNAPQIKKMMATVHDAPQLFHLRNRGIVYHCQDAKIKDGVLTIVTPDLGRKDKKKYGILDGGHTRKTIEIVMRDIEAWQAKSGWTMPRVRVRFYINVPTEALPSVAESLNTSRQVKDNSLANYRNEFDWYKRVLQESGWKLDTIAFMEGESRDWTILTINKRASLFVKDLLGTKSPLTVYKSAGRALQMYLNNKDEYKKLGPVLADVVALPEFIQSQFSDMDLFPVPERKRGRPTRTFWKNAPKGKSRANIPWVTKHVLDEGLLLPMAAAFREALVLNRNNEYRWSVKPEKLFAAVGPQLFEVMETFVAGSKGRIQAVASDPSYWSECQTLVSRALLKLRGKPLDELEDVEEAHA